MLGKFKKINDQAAKRCSKVLSRLTNRPVDIKMNVVEIATVKKIGQVINADDMVAVICLPVSGDINGAAVLVWPAESAIILCDLLTKEELSCTRNLSEFDKSALKETANIIAGNYIAVLSNTLQIKVCEHLPIFSFDRFGTIFWNLLSEIGNKLEVAILVNIVFVIKPMTFIGNFLLVLGKKEFEAIL